MIAVRPNDALDRKGGCSKRHKDYLAELAARKAHEREAESLRQAGRLELERRERMFQNYWMGANESASLVARRDVMSAARNRQPCPPTAQLEVPQRQRRQWNLGGPVVFKITDGAHKGQLLHVERQ